MYQRYLQEPRSQLKYYDDVHVDDDGGDGLNDRYEVENDEDVDGHIIFYSMPCLQKKKLKHSASKLRNSLADVEDITAFGNI